MKRYIRSTDLGRFVGSRLMTNWTASLLVYGSDNSDAYYEGDFDQIYCNS